MIDNSEVEEAPFYVKCNKCGSLNVEVTAYDRCDLELKCKSCGQILTVGHYNACEYVDRLSAVNRKNKGE